jgi:hypothetical protein
LKLPAQRVKAAMQALVDAALTTVAPLSERVRPAPQGVAILQWAAMSSAPHTSA